MFLDDILPHFLNVLYGCFMLYCMHKGPQNMGPLEPVTLCWEYGWSLQTFTLMY